ncbi:type VI secretion system contractile sheath domain-containing protein [Moellerella wisconsensis]|uniref:type VI secretion system contractile sheath domain-containing protein n=1 Tax=Moellerella wisconsensis TaxID=158849 RepID=UPI0006997987|nr:type VI secretion system contractile sheath large subunit [Moellerella wisconsensis]
MQIPTYSGRVDKYPPNNILLTAAINRLIYHIDILCSQQLTAVISHTEFLRLEASWLSVFELVNVPVAKQRVNIKLLDYSWQPLAFELNTAFSIKQTRLFHLIYHQELNTAGGLPFGLVLIDHRLKFNADDEYDDLYTAQRLAELGEQSLCPIVLSCDLTFLGDNNNNQWIDLNKMARILQSEDYTLWHLLREHASAKYLYLTLPDFILRKNYQTQVMGFIFYTDNDPCQILWGNSAYLLCMNIIREFERISWFGFLRAYDENGRNGAIIQSLNNGMPIIGKIDIPSEQENFWAEQGFIPFSSIYLSGQKGFFSNYSVQKLNYKHNRQLSMLQTNLIACRFAHFIKMRIRNHIGLYDTIDDCKQSIEQWLKKYVSEVDYGEESIMADYPLKQCAVAIEADPDDPTRYLCQINLRPQYQYEINESDIQIAVSLAAQDIG